MQHKQLSCALAKECKWASARALEEGHRLTELSRKLDKVAPEPARNYIYKATFAASCLLTVFKMVVLQMAAFKESEQSSSYTGEGDLSGSEKGAGG